MLILLYLLINVPSSITKPFYSKGEPREALSSQYMLKTNNWVIAKRYGDEIQTKPPFSHWISAVSSLPAGKVSEFTSRIPSLLFSFLVLVGFYCFLSKQTNPRIAFYSCLFLLLTPEWLRASQTSRVDMTLAGAQTLGTLVLYQYYLSNFKNKKLVLLASLLFGMAFLTKGPVGLVLPLASFGGFLLIKKIAFKKILLESILIATIASILPLCWYLFAYKQLGDQFIQVVFLENFQRLSSTMSDGEEPHEHSFIYLYSTVILGLLPFSLYLIAGLSEFKFKQSLRELYKKILQNDLYLYFVVFTLVTALFFAIPSSKRSVYLLPIYPYLAFFLTIYFQEFKNLRFWKIINYTLLSLISFLGLVVLIFLLLDFNHLPLSERKLLELNFYQTLFRKDFGLNLHGLVLVALTLIPLIFKLVLKRFPKIELQFLTVTYIILLILISNFVLPRLSEGLTTKYLAKSFEAKILHPELPIYSYNFRDYGLNFYLHGHIQEFPKTVTSAIPEEQFYMICKELECQDATTSLAEEYTAQKIDSGYFSFEWPSKQYTLYYLTKKI